MAISFKGVHFPPEVILMGVRWYLAYPLSTRHVEELMEERGVELDHATINRWVIHIPSDLVVTSRFSHHTLALAMGYPHDVSSAPTAICMEMRHGPDRQSDTRKPHDHR